MSFLVVCAQTEEAYVLVRRCVWNQCMHVSSVCMSSVLTHAARSSPVGVLLDTDTANFDGSSLSV